MVSSLFNLRPRQREGHRMSTSCHHPIHAYRHPISQPMGYSTLATLYTRWLDPAGRETSATPVADPEPEAADSAQGGDADVQPTEDPE